MRTSTARSNQRGPAQYERRPIFPRGSIGMADETMESQLSCVASQLSVERPITLWVCS